MLWQYDALTVAAAFGPTVAAPTGTENRSQFNDRRYPPVAVVSKARRVPVKLLFELDLSEKHGVEGPIWAPQEVTG